MSRIRLVASSADLHRVIIKRGGLGMRLGFVMGGSVGCTVGLPCIEECRASLHCSPSRRRTSACVYVCACSVCTCVCACVYVCVCVQAIGGTQGEWFNLILCFMVSTHAHVSPGQVTGTLAVKPHQSHSVAGDRRMGGGGEEETVAGGEDGGGGGDSGRGGGWGGGEEETVAGGEDGGEVRADI